MLLRLVRDTTTITLSGDGATVAGCTYVPNAPQIAAGSDYIQADDLTVAESASVILSGTTSNIRSQIQAIESLFPRSVVLRDQDVGQRCFVEYRAENSGDIYRSEVLAGRVEIFSEPLTSMLEGGAVEVRVLWERRYFWEGPEAEIYLDNSYTGVPIIGGVPITNHHDSTSHENYVDIASTEIDGVLPAPARVTLESTGLSAISSQHFYVTNNALHNPTSWSSIFEGENATGTGSNTTDGSSSNGFYRAASWTGALTHTTQLLRWTISSSQLDNAQGGWFHALLRTADSIFPNPTYVKLKVMIPATTPLTALWEGPEQKLTYARELHHLGAVPLPPGRYGGTHQDVSLVLSARAAVSGSLNVDFLQLCGPDSFHHFEQIGYQVEQADRIISDGMEEAAYLVDSPGLERWNVLNPYKPYLYLFPGVAQRVRVLMDEQTGNMDISRAFDLQLYYRPRRLTV